VKLRFLPEAHERIAAIDNWWRHHRPDSPNLFGIEIADALDRVLATPMLAGSIHRVVRGVQIRRALLPKTRQWIYYSVHVADKLIVLHSVWGAARRRGPKL
jgi:hypothetical protein